MTCPKRTHSWDLAVIGGDHYFRSCHLINPPTVLASHITVKLGITKVQVSHITVKVGITIVLVSHITVKVGINIVLGPHFTVKLGVTIFLVPHFIYGRGRQLIQMLNRW